MGLFDDLIRNAKREVDSAAKSAVNSAINNASQPAEQQAPTATQNKTETVVFNAVPSSLDEFKALPESDLSTPFKTAALTVLALCIYPDNKELALSALQFISGPREILPSEKQFINDRFMDGKNYIPRSYFSGATPANDYTPSQPLTVKVCDNPYSYNNGGYAVLYLTSGGADSPRQVTLRLAKDGKWYLWEQMLLGGIRPPESDNPWA